MRRFFFVRCSLFALRFCFENNNCLNVPAFDARLFGIHIYTYTGERVVVIFLSEMRQFTEINLRFEHLSP